MKICVKCEHPNSDEARYCARCNAFLPLMAQAPAEEETLQVNERLRQLEEAAQRAGSGEWSPQQLGEFLAEMLETLAEKERAIREIEIPEEAMEDFQEELEVGFSGIRLYNEGVHRMLAFAEDPDPVHLEEGLELVRQGNAYINEAMRINRENRRRLEERYLDSSTML